MMYKNSVSYNMKIIPILSKLRRLPKPEFDVKHQNPMEVFL